MRFQPGCARRLAHIRFSSAFAYRRQMFKTIFGVAELASLLLNSSLFISRESLNLLRTTSVDVSLAPQRGEYPTSSGNGVFVAKNFLRFIIDKDVPLRLKTTAINDRTAEYQQHHPGPVCRGTKRRCLQSPGEASTTVSTPASTSTAVALPAPAATSATILQTALSSTPESGSMVAAGGDAHDPAKRHQGGNFATTWTTTSMISKPYSCPLSPGWALLPPCRLMPALDRLAQAIAPLGTLASSDLGMFHTTPISED
ncbi:hypothetical protein CCMA1212_010228 [Trichoderma ghanense]|uniref:Uncharacterized protein n=1 Tax=Trichoderma ghanense TaxID=65468 RepID=A0ABY2GR15_9HYPO